MAPSVKKRQRSEACSFCKKDHMACIPGPEMGKCRRCIQKGLPCYENQQAMLVNNDIKHAIPTKNVTKQVIPTKNVTKQAKSSTEHFNESSDDGSFHDSSSDDDSSSDGSSHDDSSDEITYCEPCDNSSDSSSEESSDGESKVAGPSGLFSLTFVSRVIQYAYWLQHLKRFRDSNKHYDTHNRRFLNISTSGRLAQNPLDLIHKYIRSLQKQSISSLASAVPGTQRSSVPYSVDPAVVLMATTFFTRRIDLPDRGSDGPLLEAPDRATLRKYIQQLESDSQLEYAMQLQEGMLLSYQRVHDFTAECQADLKKYQAMHDKLLHGFNNRVTLQNLNFQAKHLCLPKDHLPFLEHSSDLIHMAIKCRMFFESKDLLGRSLLHVALANNQVDVCQLIAESKLVDQKDSWGVTPIHLACMKGNIAAVQALLLRGVSIATAVGVEKWLPWHHAAFSGNKLVVEKMLETLPGANLEIDCRAGYFGLQTAISIGARYNHKAVVQLLLDHGANPDKGQLDTLGLAVLWGSYDVVKLLLKRRRSKLSEAPQETRDTALHDLCLVKAKDTSREPIGEFFFKSSMKLLLCEPSIDPNATANNGQTPLHLAVLKEREDLVKMLVKCPRVLPDLQNSLGETPLFIAVRIGSYAIVKMLLGSGRVNIDIKNRDGKSPMDAAWNSSLEIVQLIWKYREAEKAIQGASRKRKHEESDAGPAGLDGDSDEDSESDSDSVSDSEP